MAEDVIDVEVLDGALNALLSHHPEVVMAALAPDGFRVPMPAAVGLADHQVIPVPTGRATMVDLVIPADGMRVVTAWERACRKGIALDLVRTRSDPDRPLSLVFVDERHRFGVWLAALVNPETGPDSAESPRVRLQVVSSRPRNATIRKDWHGIIQEIDDRVTGMLGWSPTEMIGARSTEFLHPDDHERALASWLEMLAKQESQRIRMRHRCRDGSWMWVESENVFHPAERPENAVVITQLTDISDEMAAYEALDRRERLFRRLAESLPIGLLQLRPDGTPVYANARLGELLGVPDVETLDGQLATVDPADRPALDTAVDRVLRFGVPAELEITAEAPGSGLRRRCAVSLVVLTADEDEPGALMCVDDITESARMREELKARATFDTLTGCLNRASVMTALDRALAGTPGTAPDRVPAGSDLELTAVIFVDLDRFKLINDTLGHAAGDEVLVRAAELLTALLRADDLVGRIGGDEFLLLCQGISGPAEALAIADRVSRALHRSIELAAGRVELRASVGVACSTSADTSDMIIAQADAAMYEAKRKRHGRPVLYTPELGVPEPVRPG